MLEERAVIDELIAELEREQRNIRAQIELAREEVGAGKVVDRNERRLRTLYTDKLVEASNYLARFGGNDEKIERLRKRVPPLMARITSYQERMEKVVDLKLEDVRQTVVVLKELLDQQAAQLNTLTADSQIVAGDIAYQTFLGKAEQIDEVVLRADVGKLDVLYQSKEDLSQEINGLFQKRTDELRTLQETFDEVR